MRVCSFDCTMWSTPLERLSWCYFRPLHSRSSTDFDCDNMSLLKGRKIRTFALLFCILTFTTFLFSYTLLDPSLYFFKYAFRLSAKGPCACRQCMTELEDDPWFAEHFNQSIHPLMTRENSALSDETFKWWQVRFTGCAKGICVAVLHGIVKRKRMRTFSFWEQMRRWKEGSWIKNRNHTLLQCSQEVFVFATLIVSNPRDLHQDQVVRQNSHAQFVHI